MDEAAVAETAKPAEAGDRLVADRVAPFLATHFGDAVSRLSADMLAEPGWTLLKAGDEALKTLGIDLVNRECTVAVRSLANPVGRAKITGSGKAGLLAIDNAAWRGELQLMARFHGDRCTLFVGNPEGGTANIPNVFLRSPDQFVFWGYGSSAVDVRVEIEGAGRAVIIGDDALFSAVVWIRNHDMHGIVDLDTMKQTNLPGDTVIERHVWLGQDALLLRCPRIGAGSIVAARAVVNRPIERFVAAGGIPARTLRQNTTWSRTIATLSPGERKTLDLLRSLPPHAPG